MSPIAVIFVEVQQTGFSWVLKIRFDGTYYSFLNNINLGYIKLDCGQWALTTYLEKKAQSACR